MINRVGCPTDTTVTRLTTPETLGDKTGTTTDTTTATRDTTGTKT